MSPAISKPINAVSVKKFDTEYHHRERSSGLTNWYIAILENCPRIQTMMPTAEQCHILALSLIEEKHKAALADVPASQVTVKKQKQNAKK